MHARGCGLGAAGFLGCFRLLILFTRIFRRPLFSNIATHTFNFFLFSRFMNARRQQQTSLKTRRTSTLIPNSRFRSIIRNAKVSTISVNFSRFPYDLAMTTNTSNVNRKRSRTRFVERMVTFIVPHFIPRFSNGTTRILISSQRVRRYHQPRELLTQYQFYFTTMRPSIRFVKLRFFRIVFGTPILRNFVRQVQFRTLSGLRTTTFEGLVNLAGGTLQRVTLDLARVSSFRLVFFVFPFYVRGGASY